MKKRARQTRNKAIPSRTISRRTKRQSFPAACTIVARNYLAHARVLAKSYLKHHPGAKFYLLVVDGLPDGGSAGPGITLVKPDEIDLPYFFELCFKYDVTDISIRTS
jgi:hypothetical protein